MLHISVVTHPHLWALWHFCRYYCYASTFCALFSTLCLPCDTMLAHVPHIRKRYLAFIDVVCFIGFKWRKNEPSLGILTPPRMAWLERFMTRYFAG